MNQSSGKNYLNVIPVTCDGDAQAISEKPITSYDKQVIAPVKKEKEKELENKLNEQKEAKQKAKYERQE